MERPNAPRRVFGALAGRVCIGGAAMMGGVHDEPPPFPQLAGGMNANAGGGADMPGGTGNPITASTGNPTTASKGEPPFVIVIDTREQTPLVFPASVRTERGTLHTGDYSVRGCEGTFTVERKSLADLVHTIIHERERFVRELVRMRAFKFRRVLCTASMDAVRRGNYPHSLANPKSVVASIATFEVRYDVPFVFAGSNDEAVRRVIDWAQYFTRECALNARGFTFTGGKGDTPTPPGIGSSSDPLTGCPTREGAEVGAIPPYESVCGCHNLLNKAHGNGTKCLPLSSATNKPTKMKGKRNNAKIT